MLTGGRLLLSFVLLAACGGGSLASVTPAPPDWTALAAKRLPLLSPCTVPGVEERLLCGTLEVWESRELASGRKIGLKVIVAPAENEKPPNDPVVIFAGGPGGTATDRAHASTLAGPVRSRDILLIDQRGTGVSNPLDCDFEITSQAGELVPLYPREAVARCAAEPSCAALTPDLEGSAARLLARLEEGGRTVRLPPEKEGEKPFTFVLRRP